MSGPTAQLPAPGWFPDPHGSPQRRWWDGARWTEHLEAPTFPQPPAMPPPIPIPSMAERFPQLQNPAPFPGFDARQSSPSASVPKQAPQGSFYNFYDQAKDAARGKNTFATNALVLGILCLVGAFIIPLKVIPLLTAVGAIMWGVLGARRANRSGIGRSRAIWGVVMGSLGVVLGLVALAATSPAVQSGVQSVATPAQFNKAGVEKSIIQDAAKQGITLKTVQCPSAPSMTEGNTFECIATDAAGTRATVSVKLQDSKGDYTWQMQVANK